MSSVFEEHIWWVRLAGLAGLGVLRLGELAGLGMRSLFCFHYIFWNEQLAGVSSVFKNTCNAFFCFRRTILARSVWLGWLGWAYSHYLIFIVCLFFRKMASVSSVCENKGWAFRRYLKNTSVAFRLAGLAGLGLLSLFCSHYMWWNERITSVPSAFKNICWAFRLFYYSKSGGFSLGGLAALGLLSLFRS